MLQPRGARLPVHPLLVRGVGLAAGPPGQDAEPVHPVPAADRLGAGCSLRLLSSPVQEKLAWPLTGMFLNVITVYHVVY